MSLISEMIIKLLDVEDYRITIMEQTDKYTPILTDFADKIERRDWRAIQTKADELGVPDRVTKQLRAVHKAVFKTIRGEG